MNMTFLVDPFARRHARGGGRSRTRRDGDECDPAATWCSPELAPNVVADTASPRMREVCGRRRMSRVWRAT